MKTCPKCSKAPWWLYVVLVPILWPCLNAREVFASGERLIERLCDKVERWCKKRCPTCKGAGQVEEKDNENEVS